MPILKASEVEEIAVIPFGIREIDLITGIGGVPFKKITEIFGPWSIGKSTLGLYLTRSAQEMGCDVLWSDTEFSWTNAYPRSLGIDPTKVDLIQAESAEEHLDGIEEWIRGKGEAKKGAHTTALVILDSVGHLTPRQEIENSAEQRQIGGQARLMASFCRKMKPLISMNDIALVVLNHEYDPISFGGTATNSKFPNSQPAGGKKLEYAKDLSIKLSKTWAKDEQTDKLLHMTRKDDKTEGGKFVRAQIYKNKLAPTQMKETTFALTYGQGINSDWKFISNVLNSGLISQEKTTYFYKGQKVAVGRPKFVAWAKEREAELKDALTNA